MQTKLISELQYLEFKGKFRKILICTIIGFILGFIWGKYMGCDWYLNIFFGVFLAGMPYAWTVIPVIAFGIISIIIKLFVSIFLGWIITPIAFIYNFIQMKRYKKYLLQHVKMEEIHHENL